MVQIFGAFDFVSQRIALAATVLALSACGGGGGGGALVAGGAVVAPPANPAAPLTYTVGGTASGLIGSGLSLQNNAGDDLAVSANGVFNFATAISGGSSYSVAVKSQPALPQQTCSVANGSGTVAAANIGDVVVSCVLALAAPRFAFVSTTGNSSVQAYQADATSGALTLSGASVPTGANPGSVAVDPLGKFVYVASIPVLGSNGSINAYAVNPVTGALTLVPSSPFPAGVNTAWVTVHPAGKFAYAANAGPALGNGSVSAYATDANSGALTPVLGSPILAGGQPRSISVDSLGKFAYVANSSGGVSAYTIDATTGALTAVPASPFAAGPNPNSVVVDPSGRFAFVANRNSGKPSGSVSAFTVNAASGALAPIGTTAIAAGTEPVAIAVDPSGKFVYVANGGTGGGGTGGSVSAYAVNATSGALTAVGSPVAAGTNPVSVAVDPSGKFAYVANLGSHSVSAFSINATTGALTPLGSPTFATGLSPTGVTTSR